MMRPIKTCFTALMLSAAFCVSHSAFADIVISGTRVIYPQSAKDVTVKMENRGNKPLLVQTWLDDGRDTANPQEIKLPFIVTPPVSRVDAAKGQTVRITYLGQPLPADRETMYWFNVLEVPPKSKDVDAQNMLQLAFRTRIKMFYRPDGLKGEPAVAAGQLKWSQQGSTLTARNDSPFYVSIARMDATIGGKKIEIEPHYVSPFATQSYSVKEAASARISKVTYISINDFGGSENHEANVN
ncbi:fimbrial chaperone [Enterobacter hormaechei]|uniref:fimbrial chaperone n=1 Tax=Enterobacter hormaechei TaxID=158836 RepID=UPI00288979CA|nr:fimbrial chaperone [Enterobacter hormaechei]WNJ35592.1 fimbrial chaperone [Enterobacter hormaechei subsp. hormaechei]